MRNDAILQIRSGFMRKQHNGLVQRWPTQSYESCNPAGFPSYREDNRFHLKLVPLMTAVVYLMAPGKSCCLPSRIKKNLLDCGSRTAGFATLGLVWSLKDLGHWLSLKKAHEKKRESRAGAKYSAIIPSSKLFLFPSLLFPPHHPSLLSHYPTPSCPLPSFITATSHRHFLYLEGSTQ